MTPELLHCKINSFSKPPKVPDSWNFGSRPGVIALLDFDFLGDFRRFSRRFSQKFRRFFSLNGHNTSIIKYCTMKMNLPNFLPQQDVLLYSCPQLQSRYYIHTMHYPMSEGMSQIIIQF